MIKANDFVFYAHRFGLAIGLVGLPLSNPMMSISMFVLAGVWLLNVILQRDLRTPLQKFWTNRSAVFLLALYLLHVAGLLFTSDFGEGAKDLRVKLPLLVLPLVLAGLPPLDRRWLYRLLVLYVTATFGATLAAFTIYFGVWGPRPEEIREIVPWMSHIRLALNACLCLFIALYFVFAQKTPTVWRALAGVSVLWMGGFLLIIQVISAWIALGMTAFALILYLTWKLRNPIQRYALLTLLVAGPVILTVLVVSELRDFYREGPIIAEELEERTAGGDKYGHYVDWKQRENGHYVWLYIAWTELEASWEARSSLKIHDPDAKGNTVSGTLVRFLASKGLRKDREGMAQLSDEEIRAIESGVANVRFMEGNSLRNRIYQVIWEFDNYLTGQNPEGNSVTMRLEFWKVGWSIFREHPVIGVGTGDVQLSFNERYQATHTQLSKEYWHRTHNQYLAILIAFGLIGGVIFALALFSPFLFQRGQLNYFFAVFYLILLVSMLSEDTLETQAGVTLFTLPFCLFLFGWERGESVD